MGEGFGFNLAAQVFDNNFVERVLEVCQDGNIARDISDCKCGQDVSLSDTVDIAMANFKIWHNEYGYHKLLASQGKFNGGYYDVGGAKADAFFSSRPPFGGSRAKTELNASFLYGRFREEMKELPEEIIGPRKNSKFHWFSY